jgi:Rrf2 family cysteine metabolism transcriptional repressor
VNFSAKTEYGVRLMVALGRDTTGGLTSLKAIAESEGLPLSYLEHVVASLKRAGLVTSSRGAHGGYKLARPAAEIAMDEVVIALEGHIAPMECFVHVPTERVACSHEGDGGMSCSTRLLWMRVQGGVIRALQGTTLAELVEFEARHQPRAEALA